MKRTLAWSLLLLAIACKNPSPGKPADIKAIAIQPIGPFSEQAYIEKEIGAFFHKPVLLLPPIPIPKGFLNTTKSERYCADSILRYLTAKTSNQLPLIIAVTEKDIFTTVRDKNGAIKAPAYKYAVWGIFGLGDCPGRASVMSNFRLHTPDSSQYRHRIRTVVLHELGHNFGLPHCPNPHCIMNDANESISTIDKSADDYCRACRARLGL